MVRRNPRAPRDSRLLSPGLMWGTGGALVALGVYLMTVGGTVLGAFCFLIAVLTLPMGLANASIRRRIHGDPKPFVDQPVHRFFGVIAAAAGAGLLALGLWSRGAGGDAGFHLIFFFMAGAFWLMAAVHTVLLVVIARVRKRMEAEGSREDEL
jgi:hypothetical protein